MILKIFSVVTLISSLIVDVSFAQLQQAETHVSAKNDTLKIGIAITTRHLMELVTPAFTKANTAINISTRVDETGRVVEAVMTGKASVAITTRDLKDFEKEKSGLIMGTPIGLDGLVLVVSNSIPLQSLTFEQIVSIWTGTYVNWKEIGGPDLPITVIGRAKEYDPIMLFADFMKLETKAVEGGVVYREKDKTLWRQSVVVSPSTDEEALGILHNAPGSITYFPLQIFNNYKVKGYKVKALEFDGVQATPETISNGEYFIHRRLNVMTNGKPKGVAKTFVDFMLSDEGQKLIKDAGFLSLH